MSLNTHEIPPDRWPGYLDGLSEQYQGWSVTVEVLGREFGDQPFAEGLPLQGLSYERKGSAAGDILIELGDIGMPYQVHRIDGPRRLHVADAQPGAETDLQVESEDGISTLVRIRRRPELPPA